MKAAILLAVVALSLFSYFEYKTRRLANDRNEIIKGIEKKLNDAREAYLASSKNLQKEIDSLRIRRTSDSLRYAESSTRLKARLAKNENKTKIILLRLDSIGDLPEF